MLNGDDTAVNKSPFELLAIDPTVVESDNRYVRDIADSMITLPWHKVYGLSYHDLMKLPFDEYLILKQKLEEDESKEDIEFLFKQAVLKRLDDLAVILLRGELDRPPS